MSILTLIIKREFIAKVRNKSFIVMTFLSPLLFFGIAALVAYLSNMKSDAKQIAIHDETGMFVSEFKNSDKYLYIDRSLVSLQVLKDSVAKEKYEGVLFIPKLANNEDLETKIQYISNDSPAIIFVENLQDVIATKLTKINFQKANLDTLAISNAEAKIEIGLAKSTGEESLRGLNEIKIAIGGLFGYLIMMFIIIYGNMVMRSVIEEKTNRIIEIIISSVRPFQLMMGKIIGTSLAGVLQFAIWAVVGFALLFGASAFFGVNVGPTNSISPEMIDAAQSEMGTMQRYINELWNLPITKTLKRKSSTFQMTVQQ